MSVCLNNNPHVVLTDTKDDLKMFCYDHNLDMDSVSPETRASRGLVFNENGLVSVAFGYTPAYSTENLPQEVRNIIEQTFEWCTIFPSYEGTLIRCFNYNDKWYLTTHRKLDAFKSYWGGKTSFGESFVDALDALTIISPEFAELCPSEIVLEAFYHLLDPNSQYIFLLRSTTENRIVCTPPEVPTIIPIAKFTNGLYTLCVDIPGMDQQLSYSFSSVDEMLDFAANSPVEHFQGLIVFTPYGQFKIFSPRYNELYNLRGNEPSIMYRYLQIRRDKFQLADYIELYPEYSSKFLDYESFIQDVLDDLMEKYTEKYILKNHTLVFPPNEHRILSSARNMCKATQVYDARKHIEKILFDSPPTVTNKLIQAWKLTLKKAEITAQKFE